MPYSLKKRFFINRSTLRRLNKALKMLGVALIILIPIALFLKSSDNSNDKAGRATSNQEVLETNTTSAKGKVLEAPEEDLDTVHQSQTGSNTNWYLITVLIISTGVNVSIAALIIFNHRKRVALLTDKKFVEPEAFQETMRTLSASTKALDNQLSELKQNNDLTIKALVKQHSTVLSKLEEDSQQHGEKIQDIMNAFLALNPKLDEKDKEIKRYKEGHDSKLVSKYILGYIKIRDQISKMTNSDQLELKNLEQLIERLNMEIEHADVKEIEVFIGDKFLDEKYGGKLAAPKLVLTDVTEKDGTIVSVDLAGYEFTGNERNIILRPAKVSVYKLQQKK